MSITMAGPDSLTQVFGRARRVRWVTRIAVGLLVLLVLVAVLAPWIVPHDPNAVDILNPFAPAGGQHLLGTDENGRDLLSRLLIGARTSLFGPALVVGTATVVAVTASLVAAWYGGWADTVVARLMDVLLAFPGLLIAIVASAVFGASLTTAALALSFSYIPFIGRVLRAEALRQRRMPYVQAAWIQGMSAPRICLTQLLPNLLPLLVAQVILSFSYAVIDLAAVSFLGLGVQAPTADWGTMIALGQDGILQGHATESIAASACLVVLILSLGIVGDALGERAERG